MDLLNALFNIWMFIVFIAAFSYLLWCLLKGKIYVFWKLDIRAIKKCDDRSDFFIVWFLYFLPVLIVFIGWLFEFI